LFSFLQARGGFLNDLAACTVCHQIAIAVDFLHTQGIVHRDMKLENILVMQYVTGSRVVLSDFGAATTIKNTSRLMSIVGTRGYLAP